MKFTVGQVEAIERSFSEEEVRNFSKLSMDDNPVHFDAAYAATTRFGQCIVQGPMVASLIGGVLGSKLPGPGTIYIQQTSRFVNPVFIGERLRASVEVVKIREDKPIITLRTVVEKLDKGEIAIEGEATVMFLNKL